MKDNYLLDQIKRLNRAFLRPDNHAPTLIEAVQAIADITASATLIFDKNGVILAGHLGELESEGRLKRLVEEGSYGADSGLAVLIKSGESLLNEPFPAETTSKKNRETASSESNLLNIVVPIGGGGKRLATLLLSRPGNPFERDHLVLAEICATLLGMLILKVAAEKEEEDNRNRELAEGAFESLSYSEVEAIREILKHISNNESVVVASKIADSLGITRSVIVNALRKFESAGIIESRSLGMKGTFIRVKNLHALEIVASRSAKMGSYR